MTENRFRIERGMQVVDENGNPVGNLQNIYSENESGASRFIVVQGHLLPVEAIKGVDGERLKLSLTHERMRRFPEHAPNATPSMQDQERAYGEIGLPGPAVDRP